MKKEQMLCLAVFQVLFLSTELSMFRFGSDDVD